MGTKFVDDTAARTAESLERAIAERGRERAAVNSRLEELRQQTRACHELLEQIESDIAGKRAEIARLQVDE